MIKAFKEIGFREIARFGISVPLFGIFSILGYPPLRILFLRLLGSKIGHNVVIHKIKFINFYRGTLSNLKIGDNSFIGDDCLFDLADKIILGQQVTMAERVIILTHTNVGYKDHPLQKYFPSIQKPVVFQDGCFIGVNVTILPGVTIGRESFVAAGSVVTGEIPAKILVGGAPAKMIREIK